MPGIRSGAETTTNKWPAESRSAEPVALIWSLEYKSTDPTSTAVLRSARSPYRCQAARVRAAERWWRILVSLDMHYPNRNSTSEGTGRH